MAWNDLWRILVERSGPSTKESIASLCPEQVKPIYSVSRGRRKLVKGKLPLEFLELPTPWTKHITYTDEDLCTIGLRRFPHEAKSC